MTRRLHTLASALSFWLATDPAFACACCTNRAGRYVDVEPLSASRLDMIGQMTFAKRPSSPRAQPTIP